MSSIIILNNIIDDIHAAQKVDRESVIIELITNRLDICLDTYINTLNKDVQYLKARNHLKMIRKLTK